MEASVFICSNISTFVLKSPRRLTLSEHRNAVSNPPSSESSFINGNRKVRLDHHFLTTQSFTKYCSVRCTNSGVDTTVPKSNVRSRKSRGKVSTDRKLEVAPTDVVEDSGTQFRPSAPVLRAEGDKKKQETPSKAKSSKTVDVRTLRQNGDPMGRRDIGKSVVRWICEGMKAMASDIAMSEIQGEFAEVRQRMGPGLTFVIQSQPYLTAIPMPLGLESVCLKACTHYPTLFDNFQRELRDVLVELESKALVHNWRDTESWKLLKELATSAQHKSIARKISQPKTVQSSLGMDLDKVKAIQSRIDDFTAHMSDLLRIERDVELEFTQEELDAVPSPSKDIPSSPKAIDYLVSHGQSDHELCDTICNLNAINSSIGLGGMHLVLFRVDGNHRLPPTTFSPGDMVCVRSCDSRGAGATCCMQGFVHNFGEDGCSITVALESRHGDPTFAKLFGKSVRIDRIPGLADALTYERNCEALMILRKRGLDKNNPSIAVAATLFGDTEDVSWLEEKNIVDWTEVKADDILNSKYDDSQRKALSFGLNQKRPVLIIQGPPGTGKSVLLKELILQAVKQGERVLLTAPTNAAVDNIVEKLSDSEIKIVRCGNPARISPVVASKSLVELVNVKLADFRAECDRKRSDLRKDLRHCLKDDSLASGIRQLLKQLGKALKKKEKEIIKEVLEGAHVVLATNTGAADPLIRRLDAFDLVIIDEAAQAIEASCWIPILQGKRCILAGDQCQLASIILSRKAFEGGLGVSLLERASTLHDEVLVTKLTTQFRMNDAISSWASKEMYGGTLKSSPSVYSHLLVDSPFVKPTWITQCPLLLLDTRKQHGSLSIGCEERLDPAGTGSFYNEGEADVVVQHVACLIYAGVNPSSILVQSPYVAQVQLLRDMLDELYEARGVEVSTVDSFQGREADAVIVSMVRSNTLGAVGFLGDSRRMNVAITRARKHVAVVCDSSTICHNTFLARLLRHIRRNGRVKHAEPGAYGGSGLGMDPMLA